MVARREDGKLRRTIETYYLTRSRRFSGDESFDTTPALDAGSGLGVVIEGRSSSSPKSPSRL